MIRELCVVVPAANEQDTIDACLDAIAVAGRRARDWYSADLRFRVVVVLDRCTDATAVRVARHREVSALAIAAGQVGAARAAGTRAALQGSSVARRELWLAHTDADSTVPPDWLRAQLDAAGRESHVVLGTVLPDASLPSADHRAWLRAHSLTDDHPHVHGANLGIRADVYLTLGGWPQVASGEDVGLIERARQPGTIHIVRTATIPVRTSSRLLGRAPAGFSSYLRGLAGDALATRSPIRVDGTVGKPLLRRACRWAPHHQVRDDILESEFDGHRS